MFDIQSYLQRINYNDDIDVNLETLKKLHAAMLLIFRLKIWLFILTVQLALILIISIKK